jgi:hypothetical protein
MISREQKLSSEPTIRDLGKSERMLGWVRAGVEKRNGVRVKYPFSGRGRYKKFVKVLEGQGRCEM